MAERAPGSAYSPPPTRAAKALVDAVPNRPPCKSSKLVTVIGAGQRRGLFDFSELWKYREVVYFLVWRDFKAKYRQTYLGVFWAVAQPVISMGIFTLVFGKLVGVPSDGVPYPVF